MPHRPRARAATLLVLAGLLSACTSVSRVQVPTIPWTQRLTQLQAVRSFGFSGRLAATNASAGFTAGVHWQQQGEAAHLDLVGPMGFGAAHVDLLAGQLTLVTAKGAKLDGAAATDALVSMLGFEPPLRSLRYWVLGASDPALGATQTVDAEQRLSHLQQDGWRIDYDEYTLLQQQWRPRRLTVTRDQLRLKLVVSDWQL